MRGGLKKITTDYKICSLHRHYYSWGWDGRDMWHGLYWCKRNTHRILKERDRLEEKSIILKLTLNEWTGFIWLRKLPSNGLLWALYWTFRFHKRWLIYWKPGQVLASLGIIFHEVCCTKRSPSVCILQQPVHTRLWRNPHLHLTQLQLAQNVRLCVRPTACAAPSALFRLWRQTAAIYRVSAA